MSLHILLKRETDNAADPQREDRDHDLLEALRHREPTAVEGLVIRYGERAFRLANGITGDREDAEEVVQDAFWTVVRKIDTFRGESALRSWFYRIVVNAAYQKVRSRRTAREDVSLDKVLPVFDDSGHHLTGMNGWSPRADSPAVQAELRSALGGAIDELPAAYRTVLIWRDLEGQSNLEVAEALGLSIPAVKTRVHRARVFLRKRLGDRMTAVEVTAST